MTFEKFGVEGESGFLSRCPDSVMKVRDTTNLVGIQGRNMGFCAGPGVRSTLRSVGIAL